MALDVNVLQLENRTASLKVRYAKMRSASFRKPSAVVGGIALELAKKPLANTNGSFTSEPTAPIAPVVRDPTV